MTTEAEHIIQKTEETLLAHIRRQQLFQPGDRVLAACSGGADSMAMLLFLLRRRAELGITLSAAHVNHGIRGAAAGADAAFVADFCRRQGVPLQLYDAVQAGVAVPPHPGEDWARRLRYEWFDMLAAQEGALVATAHTMTDQAETVLFRLARGTGVHGAGGIPVRRGAYVRPMLCLQRADTEAYCAALGQSYVQDATNTDPAYARNAIRSQVLPVLQTANPAAVPALARFAGQMQALDAWLQAQARALLAAAALPPPVESWRLATLRAAPPPVLAAALHSLLARHGHPVQRQVEALCALVADGRGAWQVSPGLRYTADGRVLACLPAAPAAVPPQPAPPQPALPGEYALPGGYCLAIELWGREKYEKFIKNAAKSKKDLTCCADYDTINGSVYLRTRQPGDRFAPAGRGGHRTLKKWLNAQAVPPAQRPLLPLLAAGSEVLWLWDSGFAEGLAPTAATRTVLAVQQLAAPG